MPRASKKPRPHHGLPARLLIAPSGEEVELLATERPDVLHVKGREDDREAWVVPESRRGRSVNERIGFLLRLIGRGLEPLWPANAVTGEDGTVYAVIIPTTKEGVDVHDIEDPIELTRSLALVLDFLWACEIEGFYPLLRRGEILVRGSEVILPHLWNVLFRYRHSGPHGFKFVAPKRACADEQRLQIAKWLKALLKGHKVPVRLERLITACLRAPREMRPSPELFFAEVRRWHLSLLPRAVFLRRLRRAACVAALVVGGLCGSFVGWSSAPEPEPKAPAVKKEKGRYVPPKGVSIWDEALTYEKE